MYLVFRVLCPPPHTAPRTGGMLTLVPGMVDLLLFKAWGHGIETLSNGEGSRYTSITFVW